MTRKYKSSKPGQRVLANAMALYAPTPERMRQDRVTLVPEQIADARGDIGRPYRADGLLDRLYERGDISERDRAAGEEFHRLFVAAISPALQAADLLREVGSQGSTHGAVYAQEAYRKLYEALDALGRDGSPCRLCAWYVLGEQVTISEWARREGWSGRPLRDEVAKGILIAMLPMLADHFGL